MAKQISLSMRLEPRQLIVMVLFFVGLIVSLIIGGPFFAVAFMLIWVDRVLLSIFSPKKTLMVELSSLPIIMTGAIKGPVFGVIFAFISLLITDSIALFILGKKPSFFSSIIGFEVIFLMVLAVIAGITSNYLPFIIGAILTFAVKEIMIIIIKGKLLSAPDAIYTHGLNFIVNCVLFVVIMKVLVQL